MVRVLVTGGSGQLGTALAETNPGYQIELTDVDTMDITNPGLIEEKFVAFRPDFLIHGAAMTNVDGCEDSPEVAELVNATATRYLAEACIRYGVKMIYVSTDYVFDGTKVGAYTPKDKPKPMSVYGRTKLAGEEATAKVPEHWIVRTQWVYGHGKNFVETMIAVSQGRKVLMVVDDQWGRPTWSNDLARAIWDIVRSRPKKRLIPVTGKGPKTTWARFARTFLRSEGWVGKVVPTTTAQFAAEKDAKGETFAARPLNGVLSLTTAVGNNIYLADWRESIRTYQRHRR
jgi:dTDP-4-dehydrorhamnose reductase